MFLRIRGFVQRRLAGFANRRAYGSAAKTFVRLPAVPGRAVVLRIEPPAASRPFGLPSLTPSRRSALRALLALVVLWRVGLACCSLHRITPFSPSRSARALHAGVLAAVFEP